MDSTTPGLAAFLFAVALVGADNPSLLRQSCRSPRRSWRRSTPLVWAMANAPSFDALSITLTVYAFVEMKTPTNRLKMKMDDLERDAG